MSNDNKPDNVVILNGVTRIPIPPERVLSGAMVQGMKLAVVIGYDADGDFYFASSEPDGAEIVWLLEMAKLKLLNIGGA